MKFIESLKNNEKQTIVAYGTSLTHMGGWIEAVGKELDKCYPGLVTTINSAHSGMWSTWGVENLDDRVIKYNPSVVFIEFSMNDAFLEYETSIKKAYKNHMNIISRIQSNSKECEIVLMTMNIPLDKHGVQRPDVLAYYKMYQTLHERENLYLLNLTPTWQKILETDMELYVKFVPDLIHPMHEANMNIIVPKILELMNIKGDSCK